MEHLNDLFLNGGETYTKDEITNHLSQYMDEEAASNIISEAEKVGFIYLASYDDGEEVFVR